MSALKDMQTNKRTLALLTMITVATSSAVAQQTKVGQSQPQRATPTPAHSEAEIQAALAEQALLQKWNNMMAEWYGAMGGIPSAPGVWGRNAVMDRISNQILRDVRSIKDEQDRLRLEAQLRGQPVPHVASDDVYQWYRQQATSP